LAVVGYNDLPVDSIINDDLSYLFDADAYGFFLVFRGKNYGNFY
jgi:hypothetical protein